MKHHYLKDVVTLQLNKDKCTGCGICLDVCPQEVFLLENKKAAINDRDACMECGACAINCQFEAISVQNGVGCASAIIRGKMVDGELVCDCGGDCC
ncbi:MAG: mercury methylation ferredoxin HgcB [Syntrophomonas sp.]